ncbi:MAG: hypothetical protein F7B60_00660 [Desulfurococcales archaeon]|nr:hypothetical protein [Desulfurococcales archaeon]
MAGEEYKEPYPWCVRVPRRSVEIFLRVARRLVDRGYLIESCGEKVCIPARDEVESLRVARENGIPAEGCSHSFKPRNKPLSSLKELYPELELHRYLTIGDIVVFHPRIGIRLGKLREAAEYLVRERGYRSVYAKLDTTGVERKARLIHLAGLDNPITVFREYGLEFKVDVSKAYANPRLGFERRRIASQVHSRELVLDLFAGIGGHAIHIANIVNAEVVTLDINTSAVELMAENIVRNGKKLKGLVYPILGNALYAPRIFRAVFDRIIADNPTMHKEFIGVECRLSGEGTMIHHYLVHGEEFNNDSIIRLFARNGCKVSVLGYRKVLPYSPRKNIWSVTLRVDKRSE